MTTNETRENKSDNKGAPLVWYVYIIELEDGGYYVGQTNDLHTRYAEHALGGGAKATATQKGKLVWFSHTHAREAAKAMEARLQAANERSPHEIQVLAGRFQDLVRLVCPEKTLRELTEEQAERDRVAASRYHMLIRKEGDVFLSAVCGYRGRGRVWEMDVRSGVGVINPSASAEANDVGSMNASVLLQRERERQALEAVGGKYSGRTVCDPCYKIAEVSSE